MRFLPILILLFILTSCNENFSTNEEQKVLPDDIKELKEEAISETVEEDLNENKIFDQETKNIETTEVQQQTKEDNNEWTSPAEHGETDHLYVRKGKHNFTLQWLGWDKPGTVQIDYEGEGEYSIEGEQRNSEGYSTIKGFFTTVSKKELRFTGKIVTQVAHNNNGEPCVKEGTFTFLSTKNRKYYRLQEMTNCEGGMLVDYVDIYF